MKVKVGDQVKILAGKDRNKEGKIIKTLKNENKVVVEGINIIKKHVKPIYTNESGSIVTMEAPIHVSNVKKVEAKKATAKKKETKVEDAKVEEKTGKPALEVFEEAMNNVMPALEVKARRIGGATYQVPIEVRPDRRQALALRWLTNFSRARGEKTQEERLAKEILDAANNTGASVKKKEDMHKMAEANKAFAHYRF